MLLLSPEAGCGITGTVVRSTLDWKVTGSLSTVGKTCADVLLIVRRSKD